MANIHLARNHQTIGSFNEEDVREGIRSGKYLAGDLAWREGMSEWKPLGEMASQWGVEPPSPLIAEEPAHLHRVEAVNESFEPAWEKREQLGFFPAMIQTVQAVLMSPTVTFAAMRQTGGLANPLLYFVLLSSTMFAISAFYQMAATSLNPALLGAPLQHISSKAYSFALIGSILLSPAFFLVSAFISSGLIHLSLRLLGGASRPFETTFRVICYAQASAAVFNLIPLFGSLIGLIMSAYCIIIGLKEAHSTQGWRATLAITFPGLLFFGFLLLLVAAAGLHAAELLNGGH